MIQFTLNKYSKEDQLKRNRTKPTQKQLGDISNKVRAEVKLRSGGLCEIRTKCVGALGVHMAHVTSRKHISHRTTANDLLHACIACHVWLDEHPEGIKHKRTLRGETK